MKKTNFYLMVCLISMAFGTGFYGCDRIDVPISDDTDIVVKPGSETDSVQLLRLQILSIAKAAQGRCDDDDNSNRVRRQISPLIDKLVQLTGRKKESETIDLVVGQWQQVWSDTRFTAIPGFCFEADDTYQVVLDSGFYYNISNVQILGRSYIIYVRGEYKLGDSFLPIVFTNNFFSRGSLTQGSDLQALALRAEQGQIPRANIPRLPFLNGSSGSLGNLYVDNVLRIITDGRSASISDGIYVLQRVTGVQ